MYRHAHLQEASLKLVKLLISLGKLGLLFVCLTFSYFVVEKVLGNQSWRGEFKFFYVFSYAHI